MTVLETTVIFMRAASPEGSPLVGSGELPSLPWMELLLCGSGGSQDPMCMLGLVGDSLAIYLESPFSGLVYQQGIQSQSDGTPLVSSFRRAAEETDGSRPMNAYHQI